MNNQNIQTFEADLARSVMQFLGVQQAAPSLDLLDALVAAYVRRVPWESASRIARRAQTERTEDCPRWPEFFWRQAMQSGTGGTCYESNYAFFSLLRWLGFEGYLTVNNMRDSIGCHTAIVIQLASGRWLVDVGIPIHVAIPLRTGEISQREGPFHTYSIIPQDAAGTYLITRDRHPRADIFTLIDVPVAEPAYREVTTRDYDENGLFLDRVIVTRIVDGRVCRFSSESPPYQLEIFGPGEVTYRHIGSTLPEVAAALAEHFIMAEPILMTALAATGVK